MFSSCSSSPKTLETQLVVVGSVLRKKHKVACEVHNQSFLMANLGQEGMEAVRFPRAGGTGDEHVGCFPVFEEREAIEGQMRSHAPLFEKPFEGYRGHQLPTTLKFLLFGFASTERQKTRGKEQKAGRKHQALKESPPEGLLQRQVCSRKFPGLQLLEKHLYIGFPGKIGDLQSFENKKAEANE